MIRGTYTSLKRDLQRYKSVSTSLSPFLKLYYMRFQKQKEEYYNLMKSLSSETNKALDVLLNFQMSAIVERDSVKFRSFLNNIKTQDLSQGIFQMAKQYVNTFDSFEKNIIDYHKFMREYSYQLRLRKLVSLFNKKIEEINEEVKIILEEKMNEELLMSFTTTLQA